MGKEKKENPGATNPTQPQKGGAVRALAEAAVWLWGLFILGYFYYTRNFLTLLQQLWEKASG
jgi:hypothetical protein